MRRVGIVSGGEYSKLTDIESCNFIIACDSGYEHLLKENINPDIIIGDLDSCKVPVPDDIKLIKLPTAKDDTDTMHAYRYAVKNNFDEIYLYCWDKGRLDHMISNIQCAIFGAHNHTTSYMYYDNDLLIVTDKDKIVLPKKDNYEFSVLAADKCKSVSIKGAKYNLNNIDLVNSFPLGQSNKWLDDEVIINKDDGILLIFQSLINEDV